MVLIIDNYDSFTYNLAQYLGELGVPVQVVRNDAITLEEIAVLKPSHIVISPGPGRPEQAGISIEVIRRFAPEVPILGVCLGHQAVGFAFGGQVIRAERLMHGKVSLIHHDGKGIFAGLPSPFSATRYHSLILGEPVPECLEVCARTTEGEIMAIRHRSYPLVGVQFHPESFLTEHGHYILRNFLELSATSLAPASASTSASPVTKAITIRDAVAKVLEGGSLSEEEAQAAMSQIMHGQATPAQIGAFLTALRMKGETVAEIAGCARAMRQSAVQVRPRRQDTLVDTCGTGGDGLGTFNISTATAFVVAGAGQPVAKHGNRSISSRCGSADVMEALGIQLDLTAEQIAACIDEVGIGFLFAPLLHPAMKHAIGPRRELGVRTIFNILGPLTNPAGAAVQVLGVYDARLTETLAHVLIALGCRAAFVVHGAGGMDELTTCGPNRISAVRNGHVETHILDPAELGLAHAEPDTLRGGDAQENAALIRDILSGKLHGPPRDVVLLNAAAALVAAGRAVDFAEGIQLARHSIDSGAAQRVLAQLVEFTRML
ncbi:MAG: bifunctional glutamine amidotransferase/anthranilate phosphoribosyltransferase [Ardenticatenia bacterium]|nr:MAG: bifunctional glutamine amidotransferase/anthranilate phosphoribosyltransferase [Ardenticatenia bacterium]